MKPLPDALGLYYSYILQSNLTAQAEPTDRFVGLFRSSGFLMKSLYIVFGKQLERFPLSLSSDV